MAEENKAVDAEIVHSAPQRAKASRWTRFKDAFIATSPKDVKKFVIKEVVIPGIIDIISDTLHRGVDMFLYGESRSSSRRGRGIYSSRPSYEEYYSKKNGNGRITTKSATGYHLDDMIFDSRNDADDKFEQLAELLAENEVVSVYEYYDICEQSADQTDWNYGWTSLEGSSILRDRNGWRLHMPKPSRIKD